MHNITVTEINSSSLYYQQVWDLREEILRKPLGMSLKNEDLSRDHTDAILVAVHNDKVIGCLMLHPVNKQELQMRQMAVYGEWQGKGVGSILVRAAEAWAREHGYTRIILHARAVALGFYKTLDYATFGDEFEEVGIPHYMMEKAL